MPERHTTNWLAVTVFGLVLALCGFLGFLLLDRLGGLHTVELYARVRRAVQAEGISEREAARQFGLARETVRKMLRYSIPPGYRRQQPARRPKLDAWVGIIDHDPGSKIEAQSKKLTLPHGQAGF